MKDESELFCILYNTKLYYTKVYFRLQKSQPEVVLWRYFSRFSFSHPSQIDRSALSSKTAPKAPSDVPFS